MYAPISWLKEYIHITLSTKDLMWRLTELGLGAEKVQTLEGEEVLELEITPNRPDLLSIKGIAREIAAIERKKINEKQIVLPPKKKDLPIKINNDFSLFHRYTGVILDGIKVGPSPEWLQKRIKQLSLRPINNIVDITNYVMYETGIPLHAFDYDQIEGHEMNVCLSKGGEEFISVDDKSYTLPKNAIIIKDSKKIIDLAGIKGGLNSGITEKTKTVFLHVTGDDPLLVRKASLSLALRSDASGIFERGVDNGSLLQSLKRAASLVLELSGGEIASEIIDLKEKDFKETKGTLNLERLEKVIGEKIPEKEVVEILESLSFKVAKSDGILNVTIPTYRQDIKIEEDLIEEVARVYGYNNFKPTQIKSSIPSTKIAYFKNYDFESKVKNMISGSGYNEIYTYSLVSKNDILNIKYENLLSHSVRVSNPVSLDFEYLRPSILPTLLRALKLNSSNYDNVNLFEIGKIYSHENETEKETISLSIVRNDGNFRKIKGTIEELIDRLGIPDTRMESDGNGVLHIYSGKLKIGKILNIPNETADLFGLKINPVFAEISYNFIEELYSVKKYVPIVTTPFVIEDLTVVMPEKTYIGDITQGIKKTDKSIVAVDLKDEYKNSKTLRIYLQDPKKTMSQTDIEKIRSKILSYLRSSHINIKS